jgi:hypothetical protein
MDRNTLTKEIEALATVNQEITNRIEDLKNSSGAIVQYQYVLVPSEVQDNDYGFTWFTNFCFRVTYRFRLHQSQ